MTWIKATAKAIIIFHIAMWLGQYVYIACGVANYYYKHLPSWS